MRCERWVRTRWPSGGFTIHTTILAEAQEAAEKALLESLERAEASPDTAPEIRDYRRAKQQKPAEYLQGAVLMVDHETGEVLAHVGGRDYAQVPYDFIELGKRPLGTAFFPFIYAAGLSTGLHAGLDGGGRADGQPLGDGRRPRGDSGRVGHGGGAPVYEGKSPCAPRLEQSKIAATVRFADQIGLQRVVDKASDFGFPLQNAELLRRISVGFEEVSMRQAVRAISAFASGGRLGPGELAYLDRVENPMQDRLPPPAAALRAQVIDEATAWQVHSMMAGSLYRGSSGRAG
jgi:membrane peptidoglycan carboxypeptidase